MPTVLRQLVRLGLIALIASACSTQSNATPTTCTDTDPVQRTFAYNQIDDVAPERLSLDVWSSPNPGDCPVLLWVHGGSWQAGDKATRLTTAKARFFNSQGFVFVSMNYRLAAETNDVRWPDFGDDVAGAVVWLRNNAAEVGVDENAITLIGHSAGAHLVSIVGSNPSLLERAGGTLNDVACVVSLDSVTHDLTQPPPWEVDIIELAFVDEAAQVDGSPTLQVERAGDSTEAPSFLIVTRGREARLESSARLRDAITQAGGDASVVDVSPYDHGEVSSQLGVAGEDLVTPAVLEFANSCATT